jgi:curved DNA-binding protein CbpA
LFLFNFDKVKKSHYEVLEVANTAAEGEIKRAYFNLVRKYQPDRFPKEFKEIRAAYETLKDRQRRAEYDAIGNLPSSVVPLFREAQRLDRFGRPDKAAELYQMILKSHPELDNVREKYAHSLAADDKPGKAADVWEELCRRRPDNPLYAKELGRCYFDRGWHKKALEETRRALSMDPSSIDGWSLLVSCFIKKSIKSPDMWTELQAITDEALEAVKDVKTDEWEKIYLHVYAFLAAGVDNTDRGRKHLREIIHLIRGGGRSSRNSGRRALTEIFAFVPVGGLAFFYPELKEMADLLPDIPESARGKFDAIRMGFEIEGLTKKKFHEIFRDLFRILNADTEDEDDELEVTAIEYHLLDDKNTFDPQIRRLKKEFPELYALHGSFFDAVLRTRDSEKMLYQRAKKIKKLRRLVDFEEEDEEPEQPQTIRRAQPKVGRNDPCPCGSGKKYKHCCGA